MPTQYVRFTGAADPHASRVRHALRTRPEVRPRVRARLAAAAALATTSSPRSSPPLPPRRRTLTFPPRPRPPSVRAYPRVDDIRVNDQNPGLRDYEASALRLLDKLTNGMAVEINESGTALKYKPGIVTGGRRISHDCGGSRGIGYFLEMVLCVCLFAKKAVDVTLTGITNDEAEISVDTFAPSPSPSSSDSSVSGELSLQIVKRGAAPGAGGRSAQAPIARELKTIDWTDGDW